MWFKDEWVRCERKASALGLCAAPVSTFWSEAKVQSCVSTLGSTFDHPLLAESGFSLDGTTGKRIYLFVLPHPKYGRKEPLECCNRRPLFPDWFRNCRRCAKLNRCIMNSRLDFHSDLRVLFSFALISCPYFADTSPNVLEDKRLNPDECRASARTTAQ